MSGIDGCSDTRRRAENYSSAENACTETREQRETVSEERRQSTEREAEARRNAYFASGTDEGGRSYRASSDASVAAQQCPDDPLARIAKRTEAYDRPLQDDPLGNALAAAAVGGILYGGKMAAKEALETGLESAGRSVLSHAAEKVAKDVPKQVIKHVVKEAVKSYVEKATRGDGTVPSSAASGSTTEPSNEAAGGWSIGATSAEPKTPNQSDAPAPPVGQDRVPFAPDQAPFRIPELQQESVRVKG